MNLGVGWDDGVRPVCEPSYNRNNAEVVVALEMNLGVGWDDGVRPVCEPSYNRNTMLK